MATRKSARPEPGGGRSVGPRPPVRVPDTPHVKGGAAQRCPSLPAERLRQLSLVTLRLRAIYGTALAAELALRQQAAEQDSEIADCLRAGVCDPIADELQELDHLIDRLRHHTHKVKR